MKNLGYCFFQNIADCFRGRNLLWILLAAVITLLCSYLGFDAWYFRIFHDTATSRFFGLAGMLGFFAPLFIWLGLLIAGTVRKNEPMKASAWMAAQAGILGWGLSSLLKVFTGRVPPPHAIVTNLLDLSRQFQFGIYEGGIFWGWPSSHTATAFAMSVAIAVFYRKASWVKYLVIVYAFYIGLGASMNFHWFSDFAAGVILGTVIGVVVGNSFRNKFSTIIS